jgi:hypothetical protein
MSKSMTTNNKTDKALATVPEYIKKSNRGSEGVNAEDLQIPRIGIVQALSPERKKSDPNYIDGAEEGDMFNSVTRELFKGPLLVIPVYYRKEYFLWKVRAQGGGFRGVFSTAEAAIQAQLESPDKTEVMDTAQQFCLVSTNGAKWEEAVVTMAGSNGGVSKKWNSDIRLREADRFANVYELLVVEKSNEKGSFYIFKTQWKRWVTETEYRAGEQSYLAISKGARDVSRDYGRDDTTTTTAETTTEDLF